MDGMTWVLLAIVALAAGAIAFLRLKGHLTGDAAARAIGAVVELARKAEALWSGYQGAGPQKRAWVLEQLAEMGVSCPVTRFGIPDAFVTQGPTDRLFEELGLDAAGIAAAVIAACRER